MSKYRVPQFTGLRKTKLFERVVGQAVALVAPDGYFEMRAKLDAPRPVVALTLKVRPDGQVKSLKLAGEAAREPKTAITLEHSYLVKLLADYTLIEQYNSQGLTIYDYACCPKEPALIQTGPTSFVVADSPEPMPRSLSSQALIAEGLKAEYPALTSRIVAALELIETGRLDLDKYSTTWDNAGFYGNWRCDCPDARHRGLRTKFGAGCKHALAGLIEQLAERERKQVAYRELASDLERRAERERALPADVGMGRSTEDTAGRRAPGVSYEDTPQPTFRQKTSQWAENQARQTARIDAARLAEYERKRAEDMAAIEARYAMALAPDPINLRSQGNRAEFRGIGHL